MSPSTSTASKSGTSRAKPRPKRSGGSGPTLAPQLLSDIKPEQREIILHGHRVAYRQAG